MSICRLIAILFLSIFITGCRDEQKPGEKKTKTYIRKISHILPRKEISPALAQPKVQEKDDILTLLQTSLEHADPYERKQARKKLTQAPLDDESLALLLQALKDDARCENAMEFLAELKDPRTVEGMLKALKVKPVSDTDYRNLFRGVTALGDIGDRRATPFLIAFVETQVNSRHFHAPRAMMLVLEAIGKIRDPTSVEPLIAALEKATWPTTQKRIINALGELGDPRAILILQHFSGKFSSAALKALKKIEGFEAIETLFAACFQNDSNLRRNAARTLAEYNNPEITDAMLRELQGPDKVRRRYAVRALKEFKDSRTVGPLLDSLTDKDWLVRAGAVEALAEIGDKRAVLPLGKIVADISDDERVRNWAAKALGQIADPRAIRYLDSALNEPKLSKAVAKALGKIYHPDAVTALIDALKNDSSVVRKSACLVLAGIKRGLEKFHNGKDEKIFPALYSVDKEDRRMLVALLRAAGDENFEVRYGAINMLASSRDRRHPKVLKCLAKALRDQNSRIRKTATGGLISANFSKMQKKHAAKVKKALLTRLDERDTVVLCAFPKFYWENDQAKAEQVFIDFLNDAKLKYKAVSIAEMFLNSDRPDLRKEAYDWVERNGYVVIQGIVPVIKSKSKYTHDPK